MSKHKKKKACKQRAALLIVPQPPRPPGIWNRLTQLNTPQKMVAGLTLAVLGVGYLARRGSLPIPDFFFQKDGFTS